MQKVVQNICKIFIDVVYSVEVEVDVVENKDDNVKKVVNLENHYYFKIQVEDRILKEKDLVTKGERNKESKVLEKEENIEQNLII